MCFPLTYVSEHITSNLYFYVLLEICLMAPDPGLYSYINQGVLTVDGIDDNEEMKATDVSFNPVWKTESSESLTLSLYLRSRTFQSSSN